MDLFEDQADAIALLGFMERVCNSGLFAFDLSTNVLKWSPGMYALLGIRAGSVQPTPELSKLRASARPDVDGGATPYLRKRLGVRT